jgi:hypothetical protein
VIMGGLAMPNVPVKVKDAKRMITRYRDSDTIGVCFMNMFGSAGWLDEIHYNLLIDATIDPVRITT